MIQLLPPINDWNFFWKQLDQVNNAKSSIIFLINLWSVWVVSSNGQTDVWCYIHLRCSCFAQTKLCATNISIWLVDKVRQWLDMGPMKVGPLTDPLMLLRVGWCDWMIKRQTQFLTTMLDCDDVADAWWLDGLICDFVAATILFSLCQSAVMSWLSTYLLI